MFGEMLRLLGNAFDTASDPEEIMKKKNLNRRDRPIHLRLGIWKFQRTAWLFELRVRRQSICFT